MNSVSKPLLLWSPQESMIIRDRKAWLGKKGVVIDVVKEIMWIV